MKRILFAVAIIVAIGMLVQSVVAAGTRALHKAQEQAESVG